MKTSLYDPASQVTPVLHQVQATSAQVNKAEYLYNGVGNRTSLTDRRGSQTFGYDNLDRLTSASHPLLGTAQSFTYDPVGNRTTAGNVTNAGNQLTADATHSYQYDDNGNLTRKTLLATGNYTQYTYDAENRLTKVEEYVAGNPTAAFTSTYRYDGLGRRIEKVANGQTKRYVYDGEDILLEYDGSNVLQARYTHGPGIDEPIAVTKGGSTFFYHQDGLGSVTDLTDSSGATAKSYSYDAYGTILESPGTVEQPYTYTGREFDAESGLYYYRARYYSPVLGRFISEDPIGFRGGDMNLYAYVGGNPLRWTDPFGLEVQICSRLWTPTSLFSPHTFLCVDGNCSGKYPSGNFLISPGEIRDNSDDKPQASCSAVPGQQNDPTCFENCVLKRIRTRGPSGDLYNYIGANCGQWAVDVISQCRLQCPK